MIIALDFDGVICDSVGELAIAGWRAAEMLWPETFRTQQFDARFLATFRTVRPALETGYESILIARLLADGVDVDLLLAQSGALYHELLTRERLERDQLIAHFADTRTAWMTDEHHEWLAAHRFYPGTIEAVNTCSERVYIITTKQRRFTDELLAAAGLVMPPSHVYTLEDGRKCDRLFDLCRRTEHSIVFVEDRLSTLLAVCADPRLAQVEPYLADWGYTTAADRDAASCHPRIMSLALAQFASLIHR